MGRAGLAGARRIAILGLALALGGCAVERMPMLNPIGSVARKQAELLLLATGVMLLIVIPVILATLWVVWRYRETARAADYDPEFDRSRALGAIVLFAPLITVAVLGSITWFSTHELDPYRPIASNEKLFEVQAVGLDYKWLFIYPEQGIATVNELVVPTGRPVAVRMTSDPMTTALFLPGLTSQIYAMPGMETRVNFLADRTAELKGANANYSGEGFSNQHFRARLVMQADFEKWTADVRSASKLLDKAEYDALARRTEGYFPVTRYGTVSDGIFIAAIRKFSPGGRLKPLPTQAATASSHSSHEARH
jgi:cytochrome o ubiquinol oxidase subunit II